jgi:hypothetical protein
MINKQLNFPTQQRELNNKMPPLAINKTLATIVNGKAGLILISGKVIAPIVFNPPHLPSHSLMKGIGTN